MSRERRRIPVTAPFAKKMPTAKAGEFVREAIIIFREFMS